MFVSRDSPTYGFHLARVRCNGAASTRNRELHRRRPRCDRPSIRCKVPRAESGLTCRTRERKRYATSSASCSLRVVMACALRSGLRLLPAIRSGTAADVLVYQSPFTPVLPPFDLSSPAFDRAMSNLRARGKRHLLRRGRMRDHRRQPLPGQGPGSPDPASLLIDVRARQLGVFPRVRRAPMPPSPGAHRGGARGRRR